MMELLTISPPKVHGSVTPSKLRDRVRLGDPSAAGEAPRSGVSVAEVQDAFYSFLSPPRLVSAEAIREAIVKGVAQGLFAYTSGACAHPCADGRYQIAASKVSFHKPIAADEVDLEAGFLIAPSAVPAPPTVVTPGGGEAGPGPGPEPGGGGEVIDEPGGGSNGGGGTGPGLETTATTFRYRFAATSAQVYSAFPAIANLADNADDAKVIIEIRATKQAGSDPNWLRNAVQEPLDEADVEPI